MLFCYKKEILFLICIYTCNLICIEQVQKPFILLTMLYNENDKVRIDEYKQCLLYNKMHKLIQELVVIYDIGDDDQPQGDLYDFLYRENIPVKTIRGRVTFEQLFSFANKEYPNQKIIIANADIYFDETLFNLATYDLTNIFIVLTRWNILEDGTKKLEHSLNNRPNLDSQDAWIFQTPIVIKDSNIALGTLGCDGRIAYEAGRQRYKVINPCYSIHANHVHLSCIRHYDKKYCRGKRKGTMWTYLPEHIEMNACS